MSDLAIRGNNQIETGATVRLEQVELLKATICKGATDNELALFIQVANRTGLDPFARQIHAVHRNEYDPELNGGKGGWTKKMSIQTGIDGYRLIAERTGRYDGQRGPLWCDDTGEWRDVWLADAPPSAAKVEVFKTGMREPLTGVATWREYAQRKKGGDLVRMWQAMPAHMLGKCAEALALRRAFPQELSGIYTADEMTTVYDSYEDSPTGGSVTTTPDPPVAATSNQPSGPPTLQHVQRLRSVTRVKELIRGSGEQFTHLVEAAIANLYSIDPKRFWTEAELPAWKHVLEYAVELHDHQQHETEMSAGAHSTPAAADQTAAEPVPEGKAGAGSAPNLPGGDI